MMLPDEHQISGTSFCDDTIFRFLCAANAARSFDLEYQKEHNMLWAAISSERKFFVQKAKSALLPA